MKRSLISVVLITLFLVISLAFGCAHKSIKHGTEITDAQVSKIVDGKTTRNDILIEFGDPSRVMNNGKAYFYSWTRGSKGHVLGFGSGSAYTHSLVIIFDDNDIVNKHKITRGTTEASTNVGD